MKYITTLKVLHVITALCAWDVYVNLVSLRVPQPGEIVHSTLQSVAAAASSAWGCGRTYPHTVYLNVPQAQRVAHCTLHTCTVQQQHQVHGTWVDLPSSCLFKCAFMCLSLSLHVPQPEKSRVHQEVHSVQCSM